MGSLVAELAEKLSAATNSLDFDEQTMFLNTSANTVGIGTNAPASKLDVRGTVQVGLDDTGYDVIFYGAGAGALMMWNEGNNELIVRGATADHATTSAGRIVLQTNQAAVVDGDRIGQIDFQASNETGSDAQLVSASIWAEADDTFDATGNETELVFATGASEAAAEKVRITSDGKLGINIATPASLLDVRGTVQVGVDGTGHDVKFFGDTASAYMLWDEDVDDLVLAGVAGINVSGTGTITGTLATAAQANITSLGTLTTLTVDNVITNGTTIGHTSDTDLLTLASAALTLKGTLTVGVNDTGHDVIFYGDAAGAFAMWDTSENALLVRGAAADHATDSAGRLVLQTAQTAIVNNDVMGRIDFQSPLETGADAILVTASIYAIGRETFDADDNEAALVFATASGAVAAEVMRIDYNGRVGIGTTAPNTALHIKFTDNTTNAADNSSVTHSSGIYLNNESTTSESHASIGLRAGTVDGGIGLVYTGTNAGRYAFNIEGTEHMSMLHTGKVGIGTTAPQNFLHIQSGDSSNDNYRTGTETPQIIETAGESCYTQYVVDSATYFAGIVIASASDSAEGAFLYGDGQALIKSNGANRLSVDYVRTYITSGYLKMGSYVRSDADNTDDLGTTGDRWRDVWCNQGAFNDSDINLKRDITPSVLGLDFIDKLNPVSYKWKDVPEVLWKEDDEEFKLMEAKVGDVRVPAKTHKRTHYGLVAQEVVTTLDELGIDTVDFAAYSDGTASLDRQGNKIGKDGSCALRYTEFIAPMIKALQELSAKVTALEAA